MTEYLVLEDVLWLHREIHGCPGDLSCIRDLGLIEAAVARAKTSLSEQDAYPDIWQKAAALLHSLVTAQSFLDGNKRTAWRSAMVFLIINGIRLSKLDYDAAEEFMLAVDNRSEIAKMAEFLKSLA